MSVDRAHAQDRIRTHTFCVFSREKTGVGSWRGMQKHGAARRAEKRVIMGNRNESEIMQRIEAEKLRLAALFAEMDREDFYTALGLIEQAAFLRITLEDLAEDVRKVGPVEEYTNGKNQGGRKISSALDAYNKSMRTYTKVMDELWHMLPKRSEYRIPGADEHELIAFKRFREREELDFYLSDDFAAVLERDREKALELMLENK